VTKHSDGSTERSLDKSHALPAQSVDCEEQLSLAFACFPLIWVAICLFGSNRPAPLTGEKKKAIVPFTTATPHTA
jgi:hypothetical protein